MIKDGLDGQRGWGCGGKPCYGWGCGQRSERSESSEVHSRWIHTIMSKMVMRVMMDVMMALMMAVSMDDRRRHFD